MGKNEATERKSAVAMFRKNEASAGAAVSSAWIPPEQFESEGYQLALVPLGKPVNYANSQAGMPAGMDSILFLPLTWKDLISRVRAQGDRPSSPQENRIFRFGQVCVDLDGMEVTRSDERVTLTHREFKLLRFLALNARKVISRDDLLNEVWGYENYPSTRTVDNHVYSLRQKLEADPSHPVHLRTVHGAGYKFMP